MPPGRAQLDITATVPSATADAEEWLLIFGHSLELRAGRLSRWDGQLRTVSVDLTGITDGEG